MKLSLSTYLLQVLGILFFVSCSTTSKTLIKRYDQRTRSFPIYSSPSAALANDLSIELEEDDRENEDTKYRVFDPKLPCAYLRTDILKSASAGPCYAALTNKRVALAEINLTLWFKVFRI